MVLCVKSENVHDNPFPLGNLLQLLTFLREEVKVVISILLTLHDKFAVVPRQELDGMERLYIFVVFLFIDYPDLVAGFRVIAGQLAIILVAVKFKHVDGLVIWAPGDIGEISVGRVSRFQVKGLSCLYVIDPYGHLMAGHASHWIFVGLVLGFTCEDIHLRIISHHALIHPIESQLLAIVVPECPFADAEFITVNALSINDFTTAICCQLLRFSIGQSNEQLVVLDECNIPTGRVEISKLLPFCMLSPYFLTFLPIDQDPIFPAS